MKKQEHLFEAIGQVDDRLVEEAADARRTATPWKKWAALAACMVLVLGLSASSLMLLFRGCGSSDSAATADNATASDTADGSDSAATEEADTAESTEDTAATDDASTGGAAEPGDSTATEDGANAGMDSGATDAVLTAIGPLSADADGLTAKRFVMVWADEHLETGEKMLVILDSYTMTAAEDVSTMLHYAVTAEDAAYTVNVDHVETDATEDAEGLSFPLTLAAGEEVQVDIVVVLPAAADGVAGFTLSTDGTNVTVTEQGAALDLENRVDAQILVNDFGENDGTVDLEPSKTYQLELRFLP